MKKFIFLLLPLLMFVKKAEASHQLIFRNAADITTGTLSNNVLDNSSITKQGNGFNGASQLVQTGANGLIPASLYPQNVTTPYDFVIATTGLNGANFAGTDRTPFAAVISSVVLTSGKANVFIKRGTYTISNVVSSNINWFCENGVVIRRATDSAPMLNLTNGIWDGGQFFSTAIAGVLTDTPAIQLGSNSIFKNVIMSLVQNNQPTNDTNFTSTDCVIYISSANNVLIDNLTVSSATNLSVTGRSRFMGIEFSSIVIKNSLLRTSFLDASTNDISILAKNSNLTALNNEIDCESGGDILVIDEATTEPQSKYYIGGNTLHARSGSATNPGAFTDASFSTGSVIIGNRFLADNNTCLGIFIEGGGLTTAAYAPAKVLIEGNSMFSNDNKLKTGATFAFLKTDGTVSVLDVFLVGNYASNVNAFATLTSVVNTGLRSNRLNGAQVSDAN